MVIQIVRPADRRKGTSDVRRADSEHWTAGARRQKYAEKPTLPPPKQKQIGQNGKKAIKGRNRKSNSSEFVNLNQEK